MSLKILTNIASITKCSRLKVLSQS